ncbi:MAG: CheY-like chemotaxis protein [Marinoscillum sp.]|jgi:CheY-like chemotaxis protein
MKTILLIEDNEDILQNLIEYFELEGYKILSSNNGKDGLALASKNIPDLIICDVLMNEMNGYEVLRLLLDSISTREIPFIFSSSNSELVDRAEALALGANDYIIKPFALNELLQMAKKWTR